MNPVQAVVFDMDGVLLDSEPLWQRAEIEVFGSVGIELTVADCVQTMGLRIDEVVAHWHARRPWVDPTPAALVDILLRRVRELVLAEGEPRRGLHRLLGRLQHGGTPLALATSSPMTLIDAVIERFGLRDVFSVLASAEHEPFGKPHPAVYLTAAAGLAVPPSRCVAIEDSVNGVIAAKAARMACIAVPDAAQRADPRFAIADRIADDLDGVDATLLAWSR